MNNGITCGYFEISRGVKQGCPLSALLFIMCVEALALKIKNDKNIKGIPTISGEVKISQYVDDTVCFLQDRQSVNRVMTIFRDFYQASGLKANLEKTSYYQMNSQQPICMQNLGIAESGLHPLILGIKLALNESDNLNLNYLPKIEKAKKLLQIWSQRKLSLSGKITILNTFAMSQFVYPMASNGNPNLCSRNG